MTKINCEKNFNGIALCIIIGLLVSILGTIKAVPIIVYIGYAIIICPFVIILIALLISLILVIISLLHN